jgi:hypothetical protein
VRRTSADEYPIKLVVGAYFAKAWVYHPEWPEGEPKDWTGCTGRAQLREDRYAAEALLEFSVTLGADGSILLEASDEDTAKLAAGEGVWDLFVTDSEGGKPTRMLGGPAEIEAAVTHD